MQNDEDSDRAQREDVFHVLAHSSFAELSEPVTTIDIETFQRKHGLIIPTDYRHFLLFTNGVWIGDDPIYGLPPVAKGLDITAILDLYDDEWEGKQWLPVGGDGFGNYYVAILGYACPTGAPIAFIDTSEDPEEIQVTVASGFWRFLSFFLADRTVSRPDEPVWRKIKEGVDVSAGRWPWDEEWVLSRDPGLRRVRALLGK